MKGPTVIVAIHGGYAETFTGIHPTGYVGVIVGIPEKNMETTTGIMGYIGFI